MIVLKAKIAPILHHDIPPLLDSIFYGCNEGKDWKAKAHNTRCQTAIFIYHPLP